MTRDRFESVFASPSPSTRPAVPAILVSWLAVFRPCFTAPVWATSSFWSPAPSWHPASAPSPRRCASWDWPSGRGSDFFHAALNRARWDARDVSRRLLLHILAVLWPSGEVVIAVDDTIERRWGPKIKARGINRDPVRSTKGQFVKTSGLSWLSLAVALPIPFAGRRWALPFLTVLAPSARWSEE